MVLSQAVAIARLVATATPVAFAAIEKTCSLLEAEIGPVKAGEVAEVAVSRSQRALSAVVALRAACETRKAIRGGRK